MLSEVKISLTKIHIYSKTNDNSINIRGKTSDGYTDRTILLDDPEGVKKASDLMQEIHDYHATKLADAQSQLDDQFPGMKEEISSAFEE